MSIQNVYAAAPTTERGSFTTLTSNMKKDQLAYVNRNSCMFRNVAAPLEADMYDDHAGMKITAATYAPNGNWIATGDASGKVKIWAPTHESKICKVEVHAIGGAVASIDWSEDSKRVVAVGDGRDTFGKVFMWDSGSNVGEISGHAKKLNSVSFKKTRPFRIATASEDQTGNIFHGPPFKYEKSIRDFGNFVNTVAYSPDGKYVAFGSSDKTIRVYDGKESTELGVLSGHKGSVYQITFSPDSASLVSSSADKTLIIWDMESMSQKKVLSNTTKEVGDMMVGVTWCSDLIACNLDGDLLMFNPDDELPKKTVYGHQVASRRVIFEGDKMFTGDSSGRVCAWKVGEGSIGRVKGGKKSLAPACTGLALTDGVLFSFGGGDRLAQACPVDSLTAEADALKLSATPVDATSVPNVPGLVMVACKGKIISMRTPLTMVFEAPLPYDNVSCITTNVDGTMIAIGSSDGKMRLYPREEDSIGEMAQEVVVNKQEKGLSSISFSPNGEMIAITDDVREVHLLDAATCTSKSMSWRFHTAGATSCSWSPDSTKIVSGSKDSHIIQWSVDTPRKPGTKIEFAHKGGVFAVKYLDDNTIVSAGDDGCVKTWKY